MAPVLSTVLLRTQSDARLVALAAAGHERAFEAISDRHRPALTRSLRRIMPPSRVDDALQQAFLNAWTALANGAEVRDLVPWLHRIARNAAAAALARPGYDHAELADSLLLTPGPEEDLERRDVMRRTLRGLAALPERQRSALLAVAVEGRPHAEVALDLGISETAVRQLVHRARTSMRTAVGALVPAPVLSWALTAGHTVAAGEGAAGAAIGVGGASTVASALKVGLLVAAVSTPVVHHEATRHAHHPAAGGPSAARHAPGTAAARSAAAGSAAPVRALAAAGPGARRAAVLASGSPRRVRVVSAALHRSEGHGRPGTSAAAAVLPATAPAAAPAPAAPVAAASAPAASATRAPTTAKVWLALLHQRQLAGRTRRPATTSPSRRPPPTGSASAGGPGPWDGRHGGGRPPHRPPASPATGTATGATPPQAPADASPDPIGTDPPATAPTATAPADTEPAAPASGAPADAPATAPAP